MFGSFGMAGRLIADPDCVVDEARRAEHTRQKGKSREQALAEFKKVVAKLYRKNGELLPKPNPPNNPPPPAPQPVETSSGETQLDTISPPNLTSAQAEPLHRDLHLISGNTPLVESNNHGVLQQMPSQALPQEAHTNLAPADEYSDWGYSSVRTSECSICAEALKEESYGLLDREWWTPDKKLAVAAVAGLGLTVGAVTTIFYNKFIRREKQRVIERQGRKRLHARSWNVIDESTKFR